VSARRARAAVALGSWAARGGARPVMRADLARNSLPPGGMLFRAACAARAAGAAGRGTGEDPRAADRGGAATPARARSAWGADGRGGTAPGRLIGADAVEGGGPPAPWRRRAGRARTPPDGIAHALTRTARGQARHGSGGAGGQKLPVHTVPPAREGRAHQSRRDERDGQSCKGVAAPSDQHGATGHRETVPARAGATAPATRRRPVVHEQPARPAGRRRRG
jgi:hypothetical protein